MISQERSAAARNGLPAFKPYKYNGTGRDIYGGKIGYLSDVQRKRERAAEAMPDPAPGYEWRRELTEDQEQAELAAGRGSGRHDRGARAGPAARAPCYGGRALPPLQVPDDLGRAPGDA